MMIGDKLANGQKLTRDELRDIAVGAARAEYRNDGIAPESRTWKQALAKLDDFARQYPDRCASQWLQTAKPWEWKRFRSAWNRFRAEEREYKHSND